MCLSNTVFSLGCDNIGYGCKAIPKDLLNVKDGNFTINHNKLNQVTGRRHKLAKQFVIAETDYSFIYDERWNDEIFYRKGFHIFLDTKPAKLFGNYWMGKNLFYIIKVAYKDVIAFGYNKVNHTKASYPCVIANKMRVVGVEQ